MAQRARHEDAAAANGRVEPPDLDAIEREHVGQLARAHAALAEAQDRSYWLDRWGIDLNALMRRPGARWVRWALRCVRELGRTKTALQRYARLRIGGLRSMAVEDDLAAAKERERANADPKPPSA
jgi:predicted anti-sigma-YlaC factor YlaD